MIPLYKVPRKANVAHKCWRCLFWKCHPSGSGGKSSWPRFPGILIRCHAREWHYLAPSRPAHLPAAHHCVPSVCNRRLAQPGLFQLLPNKIVSYNKIIAIFNSYILSSYYTTVYGRNTSQSTRLKSPCFLSVALCPPHSDRGKVLWSRTWVLQPGILESKPHSVDY